MVTSAGPRTTSYQPTSWVNQRSPPETTSLGGLAAPAGVAAPRISAAPRMRASARRRRGRMLDMVVLLEWCVVGSVVLTMLRRRGRRKSHAEVDLPADRAPLEGSGRDEPPKQGVTRRAERGALRRAAR